MKKIYFVICVFLICLGLSIDNSITLNFLLLLGGGYGIYDLVKNSTIEEIKEFTFANLFQKYTGVDIFEE